MYVFFMLMMCTFILMCVYFYINVCTDLLYCMRSLLPGFIIK